MTALTLALGIVFGLLTAWGNTFAYLGSRWFVVTGKGNTTQLLVRGHAMLGVVAAVGAVLLWRPGLAPTDAASWSLADGWASSAVVAIATFVGAQTCLMAALRRAEASRVAPLLGLKIAVLAGINVLLRGLEVGALQWLAVALAVSAGFVLHGVGGRVGRGATLAVIGAVACYAACDTFIVLTIDRLEAAITTATPAVDAATSGGVGARFTAAVLTASLVYTGCGVIAALLLPWFGSRRRRDWTAALPYAAGWAVAMVALYPCFAFVGTVLGSMLQSTRALWSILLGAWLGHRGWAHVETPHGRNVLAQRALAALFMIAAVGLYAATAG